MGRGQRCCEILLGVSLLLGWENEISGRRGEGKISIHASCIWTTTKGFFQTPSFRGDNCTDDNTGIFWLLVTGFTKPIFLHSPLNLAHPQPRLRLKDVPAQTDSRHRATLRPWLRLGRTGLSLQQCIFQPQGLKANSNYVSDG